MGEAGSSSKDELVLTPGGWRPKSRVHYVPPDQHVTAKGGRLKIVHTKSGHVVKDLGEIPEVQKGKQGKDLTPKKILKQKAAPGAHAPGPLTGDWVVSSWWKNGTGNPISYFKTQWTVPPEPATDNAQTVFLFNGIETVDFSWILQPVLQWGSSDAGGGSYWSITNWYWNSKSDPDKSHTFYGNLVKVKAGDQLEGIITLTGHSGSNFDYTSAFTGFSTADANIKDVAELVWAVEALECYGFMAFTDYPDAVLTAFHDIELQVRSGTAPNTVDSEATLSWDPWDNITDNGQKCVIVSDDSPGGVVYLYYRSLEPNLYFVTDKNSFGKDDVNDLLATSGGKLPDDFWVMLEGFTVRELSIDQPTPIMPKLSGAFYSLKGVTITQKSAKYQLQDTDTPQRILFPCDLQFDSSVLDAFPQPNSPPVMELLGASISIRTTTLNAITIFELVAGADPYFANVDPSQDNVSWLSQDLRVFTAVPAINPTPVAGGPAFDDFTTTGAYGYLKKLLDHLNDTYKDPNGIDPFTSILPGQSEAYTADSSVTPLTLISAWPLSFANNYNFAIARVRLRGTFEKAKNVKVFFRLWTTQSPDTDYQADSTYFSHFESSLPKYPLPAPDGTTIPFFATGNSPNLADPNNPEYGAAGLNNRDIEIDVDDSLWQYFGCFLNVYDSSNVVSGQPVQALLNGTHHCLVAQIAYDDAPIINSNGVMMNPANCDKLAQRNLEVTSSSNPGTLATHRIPQTFDIRPSPKITAGSDPALAYPDELMIDWGETPVGSTASIYWPQADVKQVIALASQLYGTSLLSASDHNTLVCKVTKGITYIPIPTGTAENLAGLLTIDLPATVVKGQEFNVVVRRITTRRTQTVVVMEMERTDMDSKLRRNWRYVVGTFQIKIPVMTEEALLGAEENTLAILKWRLERMSPTNRWHLVLQRYVEYVSSRVDGFGGDSANIAASLQGATVKAADKEKHEYCGKICEVDFDCFGDFEGFWLCNCEDKRYFRSREKTLGKVALNACEKGLLVCVLIIDGKIRKLALKP